MFSVKYNLALLILFCCLTTTFTKKHEGEDKPKWAKKDIRDYSEADMERLLDQWEEDEEPLEPDELPEHLRPQPKIQLDPAQMSNPEQLMKLSKKGKTIMMFVKVKKQYNADEVQEITKLWQGALHNNHIQAERYMVDDQRAIFMFGDGALAWDAKDYLVEQEQLQDCTIDNKVYHGLHTEEGKEEQRSKKAEKKSKKKEEL